MHVPIERDARSWRGDRGALRSTTALSGLFGTLPMLVVGAGMFGAGTAYANPEDGTVVSGSATIVQTSDTRLDIYQTSDQTMIDWRSFSIAAGEITNFYQPSSTSLAINRVTGNTISEIFGQLTANGQIMLLNTNGILFGPNSRIDVASLTASTLDISNDGFVEGQFSFFGSSDSTASVVNQGTITVKDGGLVALVAPGVANQGVIVANLGRVTLASGNAFTVDLFGDGLINLVADAKVVSQALGADGAPLDSLVSNSGRITTDGGIVVLTVNAAQGVVDNVINMTGVIEARSAVERNGEIVLFGGDSGIVRVAGTLDASGKGAGQTGGTVKVLGEYVGLFDGALIDVSGDAGGGTVLVGGNYKGQGSEPNAKVTYVDGGATINADAITSGDGGTVIVWSDETSRIYGSISVRGGSVSGDGGFVETSSKGYLEVTNAPDIGAGTGSGGWWLIDPSNIDITDTDAFTANVSGVFQSNNTGASTINVATLVAAIDGAAQNATIEVSTSAGTDSSEAGTITLTNALAANPTNTGVTLLFNADSNITINADLTAATNALNVTFTTTGDTVAVNNLITTNGGNFTVNASAAYTQADVDVNAGGGNILIEADTIALTNNTGDNALIATGTLTLRPTSTSQSIGIGTGAAGTFQLDDTEIVDLGGGFSSITIGRADGTHTIVVDGATFNDPVTIQAPSGGSITLNTATLIGAGDASITLTSGGTTTLNAGITTASQDITISDNVVLGANITLTTAGSGGNILISGTVNADANTGNRTFTLTAGTGTTEVTGAIGTTQAVESVTVTDASTATFGGAIDTRDGGVNIAATTISLASNVTTIDQAAAGSLTLTGAVTLTGDVRLDTDAATTDAALLVTGAVNADANTNNRIFALDSGTNTTTVTGAIGTTQAVESVTVDAASTATFGGAIDTRDGGVNIAATTISLASNVTTIDQAAAGTLTLTGAVTLTGDVRLDTDAATTDAALLVTGAVDEDANTNNRIVALD
ncbi:MAG: filamentous hemagglutinin N-terminal domain-containing protein, partial [Proteobacteria bacterium]|nr:filamentous hemagglutinin N-terminal domain-containing protein [Pseudomonadota bacterium]